MRLAAKLSPPAGWTGQLPAATAGVRAAGRAGGLTYRDPTGSLACSLADRARHSRPPGLSPPGVALLGWLRSR